jgi:hypothetical protein
MRHSPTHALIHDKTAAHTGRHRLTTPKASYRLPTLANLRTAGTTRVALAASVLGCLALATMASGVGQDAGGAPIQAAAFSADDRDARANRSFDRQAAAAQNGGGLMAALLAPEMAKAKEEARKAAEAAEAQRRAEAAAAAEAQRRAHAAAAANPPPVAGLDQLQMNNAKRIVDAGKAMGLPKRAYVIAVATSMQECNLYNLASTRLPESYDYPNEGEGSDHDSIGLFQQRPSSGWGSIASIMDPTYAATAFYKVLVTVPGWDGMALTYAAQRVQVSAFPSAYAKHEARAQAVVDALVP